MHDKVQSIVVKDLNGSMVDVMSIYKNKVLLVILYNNACLGCTGRAIPLAYDFKRRYPTIAVIGIHSNFVNCEATKQTIKGIFTSGENPFPIYIDEQHKIYDQFKAEGTPQWLVISEKGVLFRSIFGSQENAQNRLFYALESLVGT